MPGKFTINLFLLTLKRLDVLFIVLQVMRDSEHLARSRRNRLDSKT
jgi:hypothetical protein